MSVVGVLLCMVVVVQCQTTTTKDPLLIKLRELYSELQLLHQCRFCTAYTAQDAATALRSLQQLAHLNQRLGYPTTQGFPPQTAKVEG